MVKRTTVIIMLFSIILTATAVPAKRGIWKTLQLSNGEEILAELKGDEFGHWWQAEDGTIYTQSETFSYYEIADKNEIIRHSDSLHTIALSSRSTAMRKAVMGEYNQTYTGKKKGLIILVEFSDVTFAQGHDQELYNRIANEQGFTNSDGFVGSVRDYFEAQSGGQFILEFDVVGPITLDNGYAYYGANKGGETDKNAIEMVIQACTKVESQVNFNDYDWNSDEEVDQVFILYAGLGEANGGSENTIWPHEVTFSDAISIGNIKLKSYACGCELQSSTKIDGIGTICHEFSHCLGLPDMYDTNYGSNFGMSYWDIMDCGSYLGESFIPCGYTSYERMFCGWLTPQEITKATTIDALKPLSDEAEAYIMYNQGNANEYYLLENRQTTGWDSGLYGSGLLVLHVDYDNDIWNKNCVNSTSSDNDHQRCTIINADNSASMRTLSDLSSDPYPYGTNNCLSLTSTPAATLYNANSDGTFYMDKCITDITRNSDGTMSFKIRSNDAISENKPSGALFYESFDLCNGTGGNDNVWRNAGLKSATLVPDNLGWEYNEAEGGSACGRFGSTSNNGVAVTPLFTINGESLLSFRIGAPTGSGTSLYVNVESGEATLSQSTFDIVNGDWLDYTTVINGNGEVRLSFETSSGKFYLDEIAVVPEKDVSVRKPKAEKATNEFYSLDGYRVGSNLTNLKKGIYLFQGKKIIN